MPETMHAGTIVTIGLGIVAVAGVVLYWWADREHFPLREARDPRRTTPSVVGAVLGLVFGTVFLSSLLVIAILGLETKICEDSADKLGTSSEYSWTAGCFVEIEGDLIPYDLYRLQENL